VSVALFCCFLALRPALPDDSFATGTVLDGVTGRPIVGVTVTVSQGGKSSGDGVSEESGRYKASFRIEPEPKVQLFTLTFKHKDYVTKTLEFQTKEGNPVNSGDKISLLPLVLSRCLAHETQTVIVGKFRSPIGHDFRELTGRIAEALQFNLLTRLQGLYFPPALQPIFEPCQNARPRTLHHGKNLAQALQAHAFLFGDVDRGPSDFSLSTYVSDAYELFDMPHTSKSESVDLNNPSEASISKETYGAVLASVAAGLWKSGDCRSALTVVRIAENVLGSTPTYLKEIGDLCQSALPHIGLQPGR
jgi:hypothetical protein